MNCLPVQRNPGRTAIGNGHFTKINIQPNDTNRADNQNPTWLSALLYVEIKYNYYKTLISVTFVTVINVFYFCSKRYLIAIFVHLLDYALERSIKYISKNIFS